LPDQSLNLGALLEIFVLTDKEAHALRDDLDAVAQRQAKQIGFIDSALQGCQAAQIVQGLHGIKIMGQMQRLWTPWRRAFVEGSDNRPSGCFLCTIAATPAEDRHNLVLFRAQHVYVLLNLYPYNSGHLMVAPYAHTGDLANLDRDVAGELMHITQRSVGLVQQAYAPEAFNVGLNLGRPAGAGLPDHLHVHVVPRWNGDTNFMPVVAGTKVLPESLDQTYDRLEPLFRG
jgi:ATP adenylyltransferase